jgi:hypothetical protein
MTNLDFDLACPHCRRETSARAQRCTHCGLTMISDRAFHHLEQQVRPLAERIHAQAQRDARAAVPLLAELKEQVDTWPELTPWYHQVASLVPPEAQAQYHWQRKLLRINWVILAFFALVAIGGGLYTGDGWLALLLALPVGGWYWLGIHRLKGGPA